MKHLFIFCFLLLSFVSCRTTKVYYAQESLYEVKEQKENLLIETTTANNETITRKIKEVPEDSTLKLSKEEKTIIVQNEIDFGLIAYSFFLKPVVITGVAAGNVLKTSVQCCLSFALAFAYCYLQTSMASFHQRFLRTDFEKAKENMIEAKKNNALPYPEYKKYRKPFTKSHITVEKNNTTVINYKTDNEQKTQNKQIKEYDNSIRISREIKKDAASTGYVTNYISELVYKPLRTCTEILTIVVIAMFGG